MPQSTEPSSPDIAMEAGTLAELATGRLIRAARRSRESLVAAIRHEDAEEAALAGAMSVLDFCEEHPDDARVLAGLDGLDLACSMPHGATARELADLDRSLEDAARNLAWRLFGTNAPAAVDRAPGPRP